MAQHRMQEVQDVVVPSNRKNPKPRAPRYRSVQAAPRVVVGRRSGTRTGQPAHFALWMADLAAKSALQRLKLDRLAESTDGDVAAGMAILWVNGVKNVWDLSVLPAVDPALGKLTAAQLTAVAKYLKGKRVDVAWEWAL